MREAYEKCNYHFGSPMKKELLLLEYRDRARHDKSSELEVTSLRKLKVISLQKLGVTSLKKLGVTSLKKAK